MDKPLCGFIGQGFIGKNYADDFEERGYEVIRYDVDKYKDNKVLIKTCDIVFLCVPTPSTPNGFDYSIVEEVLGLVGKDKIAVIKSTVLPGTTNRLQDKFPDIYLMHSPEFLTEVTAKQDAQKPDRNIIGYTEKSQCRTADVINVLPIASYEKAIPVQEAEMIKYAGNCWFYFKVMFVNLLYNASTEMGLDYNIIKDGMSADKRIGRTHLDAMHKSGRGAGGHCFVKDMSAFAEMYKEFCPEDKKGNELLKVIQEKNVELLVNSGKDIDLLKGVYGESYEVK